LKVIPVIAVTSSCLPADLTEFYQHGVNAYVVKPMGFSELVKAIQRLSVFWMAVNEPPPTSKKTIGGRNSEPEGPGLFDAREMNGERKPAAHPHHHPAAGKNNGSTNSH